MRLTLRKPLQKPLLHSHDKVQRDSGIELAAKIKKHQFNLKAVTGKATTAPEIWAAVLAA